MPAALCCARPRSRHQRQHRAADGQRRRSAPHGRLGPADDRRDAGRDRQRRQSPLRQLGVHARKILLIDRPPSVQHARQLLAGAIVGGDRRGIRRVPGDRGLRQHAAELHADRREGRRVIDVVEPAAEDRRRVVVVLADRDGHRASEVRMLDAFFFLFHLVRLATLVVRHDEAGPVAAVECRSGARRDRRPRARGRDPATPASAGVAPGREPVARTPDARSAWRRTSSSPDRTASAAPASVAGASPTRESLWTASGCA